MNYVILDMEWNQPLYRAKMVTDPIPLVGEVVQIGAVKLDENFRVIDKFKVTVAPKYYTVMNRKVARITHLSSGQLMAGLPFPFAYAHFNAWWKGTAAVFTWGRDDIPMLKDNMILHGIPTDDLPPAYDLQVFFAQQIAKENRQFALLTALEMVNEEAMEAHDALHDAINTARICPHLDMEYGLAHYNDLLENMGHARETGGTFGSAQEAIADPEVVTVSCSGCKAVLKLDLWKFIHPDRPMSVGTCPECGEKYLVRLRLRKGADEKLRVSRSMRPLDEKSEESYKNARRILKPKEATEAMPVETQE